ncbi:MAG TPA: phage holin family protein [Candidatus Binataceae bacterium]|nr:phage holin family protein [Candidatus Binataceae bacterium]
MLTRMLEDLVRVLQLELRLLEAEVARALSATVDRTIAALILLYLSSLAGSFLLVALAFLLHTWLPWWLCFALSGVAALLCGAIAYATISAASSSE